MKKDLPPLPEGFHWNQAREGTILFINYYYNGKNSRDPRMECYAQIWVENGKISGASMPRGSDAMEEPPDAQVFSSLEEAIPRLIVLHRLTT